MQHMAIYKMVNGVKKINRVFFFSFYVRKRGWLAITFKCTKYQTNRKKHFQTQSHILWEETVLLSPKKMSYWVSAGHLAQHHVAIRCCLGRAGIT